jgi:hypothetical protein
MKRILELGEKSRPFTEALEDIGAVKDSVEQRARENGDREQDDRKRESAACETEINKPLRDSGQRWRKRGQHRCRAPKSSSASAPGPARTQLPRVRMRLQHLCQRGNMHRLRSLVVMQSCPYPLAVGAAALPLPWRQRCGGSTVQSVADSDRGNSYVMLD